MTRTLEPARWAGRRVAVVAPHPDDEAFGAGGTAHLAARAGADVHPLVVARGDGGVDGRADVSAREDESRRCCELLGLRAPEFLRVPSPRLREDPAAAGAALRERCGGGAFDVLLVPSPLERHDTHRAVLVAALCADIGTAEAEWWGWGVWEALPLGAFTAEVDVTAARSAKALAMGAHASQNAGRSFAAGMSARDMSQAIFARVTGHDERRAVERLLDLGELGRRRPAPATAAQARERVAAWMGGFLQAWASELWA